MVPYVQPWFEAWVDAAYGDGGFWRAERPRNHFRTASSTTPLLALAIADLLVARPDIECVVELGAGDGDLLWGLSSVRPALGLTGIDLRPRPASLPDRIGWVEDLWDVSTTSWACGPAEVLLSTLPGPTLLIAAEWLDDLPCPIISRTEHGLSVIEVARDGREHLGDPPGAASAAWAEGWWPYGDRLEIGTTRDDAWSDALRHLGRTGGLALAIDYAHLTDSRPAEGSLTAYQSGRKVPPLPDPTLNLTAAVAMDSLAAAGLLAGASTLRLTRQRDLLDRSPPPDASDHLAALATRSHHAALVDPAVWGNQLWLLQAVPAR